MFDMNWELEFVDNPAEDISLIGVFENIHPDDVYQIIRNLPDGYRTVFNMYAFEEYSHAEIAEILQISVNTSKTQLMKARKAIIAAIDKKISINGHLTNNNIIKYESTK
jgi:DNA-directed RNA polymerase specialized sigma24 family protein